MEGGVSLLCFSNTALCSFKLLWLLWLLALKMKVTRFGLLCCWYCMAYAKVQTRSNAAGALGNLVRNGPALVQVWNATPTCDVDGA